ncbi:hypothetical protein E4U33_005431 [Claviceps sp. LM78 group G4]|nr:hypothetical protein E4U33_005431 [Claviceps sp. LM78 group G4]
MREESHPPWWFAAECNASLLFGRFRPRYVADQGIRDFGSIGDAIRYCSLLAQKPDSSLVGDEA